MACLTAFETSAFPKKQDYGWCYTDREGKDATKIRTQDCEPVRPDFFLAEQERDFTTHFFELFGLPLPDNNDIYRGNSQDLLFLDDYGLVVRTGPLDVVDLINPGVLQPLYWMPHGEKGHVIAIYPGVQLLDHFLDNVSRNLVIYNLADFLYETGQNSMDIHTKGNIGLVHDVPVVIDLENQMFGTRIELKQRKQDTYRVYRDAGLKPADAIRQTMVELYGDNSCFDKWIKTFDFFQPIRDQLYNALNMRSADMRRNRLALFYDRCKKLTQRPEKVLTKNWSQTIRNRQKIWQVSEPKESKIALYRPWTGSPKDNQSKTLAL